MRRPLSLFILAFLLFGCEEKKVTLKGINKGDCFLEVNKSYASGAAPKSYIYKVEEVNEIKDAYRVSLFQKESKHYVGYKSPNYFDENQSFRYKSVRCPDGSTKKSAGIADRIGTVKI